MLDNYQETLHDARSTKRLVRHDLGVSHHYRVCRSRIKLNIWRSSRDPVNPCCVLKSYVSVNREVWLGMPNDPGFSRSK